MFTKAAVFAAVLAVVAQASLEAVPVVDQGHKGPVAGQEQHHPGNSSYTLPPLSVTGGAASSHPVASPPASAAPSVGPSTPAVVTPPIGTAGPSAGYSNSASVGFPAYTNSTTPSATLGPSVVVSVVTETVTSCPVVETVGSGATKSVNTRYTTSTRTLTKTVTVCTKCVEQPAKTDTPDISGNENSPVGNKPGQKAGDLGNEKVTKTITSTAEGGSTVVVTVTSTRTKTQTNVHTVTPGASGSPAEGAKGGKGAKDEITATEKVYKTSTLYVTDNAQPTCPPQQTVTVTLPDVTVTVTAGAGSPAETAKGGKEGKGGNKGKGAEGSKPAQITTSAPFGFGNGTHPAHPTSTKCKSTGFITKPYPSASDLFPVASAHAEH